MRSALPCAITRHNSPALYHLRYFYASGAIFYLLPQAALPLPTRCLTPPPPPPPARYRCAHGAPTHWLLPTYTYPPTAFTPTPTAWWNVFHLGVGVFCMPTPYTHRTLPHLPVPPPPPPHNTFLVAPTTSPESKHCIFFFFFFFFLHATLPAGLPHTLPVQATHGLIYCRLVIVHVFGAGRCCTLAPASYLNDLGRGRSCGQGIGGRTKP